MSSYVCMKHKYLDVGGDSVNEENQIRKRYKVLQ